MQERKAGMRSEELRRRQGAGYGLLPTNQANVSTGCWPAVMRSPDPQKSRNSSLFDAFETSKSLLRAVENSPHDSHASGKTRRKVLALDRILSANKKTSCFPDMSNYQRIVYDPRVSAQKMRYGKADSSASNKSIWGKQDDGGSRGGKASSCDVQQEMKGLYRNIDGILKKLENLEKNHCRGPQKHDHVSFEGYYDEPRFNQRQRYRRIKREDEEATTADSNWHRGRWPEMHMNVVNRNKVFGESSHKLVTPGYLHETVRVTRALLQNVCCNLIEARELCMNRLGIESRATVLGLTLCELLPDTKFLHVDHMKYGVQACINKVIFKHFELDSYGISNQDSFPDLYSCQQAFIGDFQTLASASPAEVIDSCSPFYHKYFHAFCMRKLQDLKCELNWFDTWSEIVMESFLDAMKYVWMLHKMAFACDSSMTMFYVNECAELDVSCMEAVEGGPSRLHEIDKSTFTSKVQFMITPGFELEGKTIKSQVYLKPKAMELNSRSVR